MKKCALFVLASLTLALGPAAVLAAPLFGAKSDYATGTGAYSVATADLNGDGRADLAVASGIGVSVLLNSGTGSFGAKTDFAAGSSPSSVAIGDLNGDGKPDLVVANAASNTVSVLLGHGDGSFAAKTDLATESAPIAVVIGDVNGDGKPDLVVANYSSNSVSVLLGNGDGTFGPRTSFATGVSPSSVALADLDGDGRPDLVTANYGSSSVSVLRGIGDGSFAAKTDFVTGSFPTSVAIGDLNADGKPDLATANYVSNSASVLLGNGDATFGARTDYATGNRPRSLAIGDLDGDGKPDLAVANYTANTVSVLAGNGNGTFAGKSDFVTGTGPYLVAIGDLNGDGKPDLALANSGSSTVSVLLRQFLPSSTSLGTSPNPSVIGQTVMLTASVAPDSATGTVTFRDGASVLGTATLAGGVATLATSALGAGDHSLTAAYGGNLALAASLSPPLVHTVVRDSTSVVLASSPAPSVVGQTVLATATVSPAGATGTVTFMDGASPLGTAALAGGVAALSLPGLCGGSYALSAIYGGDTGHYGSSSPTLAHVVNPAPVAVSIVSSLNPSRISQSVNFTASVSESTAGSCALTGAVQFLIDGAAFGAPVPLSGGSATVSGVTGLAAGAHAVQASYSGNASFQGGTSPAITQEVESPRPLLVGVRDLLNDQGGQVKLLWNASYLDLAPYNSIESYWVLRSVPPAAVARAALAGSHVSSAATGPVDARPGDFVLFETKGTTYAWEFVANQPAFHVANYSYVAATTRDSVAGSNPLTAFMIVARTAGGALAWSSDPDSGYSVDNLAPRAPAPFTGTYAAGVASLHWGRNPEADFAQYRLHRAAAANFVPAPDNLLAAQPDTGYADVVGGLYYYKLCAVDVHGNASGFTSLRPSGTSDVAGDAAGVFGLERVRPNPSRGEQLGVTFTLPASGPARLEMLDVSGRRVLEREVGGLGAGRHAVDLAGARRLAPGLYLVRLTQGANVRMTRVAVLK